MEFKFTDPAHDFANGIMVIRTYHDNLLATGERLVTLALNLSRRAASEEEANTAIDLHQHYTRANSLHHADEERCLFPALLGKDDILDGMIERLVLDHEEIETWWDELAGFLSAPEKIEDRERFWEVVSQFERLQREHLIRENEDFLPRALEYLDAGQQAEMGDQMATLRDPSKAA